MMYARQLINRSNLVITSLILFVLLQGFFSTIKAQEITQEEYDALVTLYNSTNGGSWTNNENWLTTESPNTWFGVTCTNGHVTHLTLNSNQLNGSIPPELGDLAYLERLILNNNQLNGSIPPELGNLDNLDWLHLYYNQLSGSIPPELGNMNDLQQLRLDYNQLSGGIPPELGNLANLDWLYLSGNPLGGSIPPELGNIGDLGSLRLVGIQLSGSIPPELGNLTRLRSLYLHYNQLSGSIPPELGNMASLGLFYFYKNQLSGSIPAELGNLTNLRTIWGNDNQLSGSIPPELGTMAELQILRLYNNQLSGSLPLELANLTNLYLIDISNNQLSGSLPPELGNMAKLSHLYLFSNQLSGNIPPEFGNLATLKYVSISNNPFSGPLPMELTNLNLSMFWFENTDLCEPDDKDFQLWLNNIPNLTRTVICSNVNNPPEVEIVVIDNVNEGSSVEVSATGSDPDEDPLTYLWDLDNDGVFETPGQTVEFSAILLDGPSAHIIKVQVSDDGGLSAVDETTVQINNAAPVVGEIIAPIDPVVIETEITCNAEFTDAGIPDIHTASWNWGDKSSSSGTVTEENGSGTVTGSHTYAEAGVYTVTLIVTDNDGGVGESIYQYIVTYNPDGGFVTGGGWIDSPEGAYIPDPNLLGKANFGFVSKYKKGQITPDGNTQFDFKVADLKFSSTSYDWLVIAGSKAMYKGIGSINGEGEYGFMLSAIDGDLKNEPEADKFRIKIWEKKTEIVVYDNQLGYEDDGDVTHEIGGGNITIHDGKDLKKDGINGELLTDVIPDEYGLIQNYPNPFNPTTTISYALPEANYVSLKIYDLIGKEIAVLVDEPKSAGSYTYEFNASNLSSGVYVYRLQAGEFIDTKKLVLMK